LDRTLYANIFSASYTLCSCSKNHAVLFLVRAVQRQVGLCLTGRATTLDIGIIPDRSRKARPRDPNQLAKLIADIATGDFKLRQYPSPA
jgi:hypothetical protein